MRLKLIVQRHSLPPVHVIWAIEALRPPYAAAGSSATVSQLLEQVNEIIPLESEDWGLEDYAVEVRGFECLHFSELGQVLKEDDEVFIRPLQTSDLRFRKISGRHQISTDGKHLIDGVAFGRPFLRRIDRPPVNIPPRKRRRVTYTEYADNDVDEHANSRQMMLRDDDLTEEDSTDDDYSARDGENDDLSMELEDLRNDIYNDPNGETASPTQDDQRTEDLMGAELPSLRVHGSRESMGGLGLKGTAVLKLLDENGRPYPGEYSNPLLDFYDQEEPIEKTNQYTTMQPKRKRKSHRNRKVNLEAAEFAGNSGCLSKRSSSASVKGVRFEDVDATTPATIRECDASDQSDDGDFEPDDNIYIDINESDKENSDPQLEVDKQSISSSISSESSLSISSVPRSEFHESSSSSSSSTSTSSELESERFPPASKIRAEAQKTSSEQSSSSTKSESEVENSSKKPEYSEAHLHECQPSKSLVTRSQSELVDLRSIPPYEGTTQTQKRNLRRRNCKRLRKSKSLKILSPDATISNHVKPRDVEKSNGNEEYEENVAHEHKEDLQTSTSQARKDSSPMNLIYDTALVHDTSKDKPIADADPTIPLAPNQEVELELRNGSNVNEGSEEKEYLHQTPPEESVSIKPIDEASKQITPELNKRRSKLDLPSSRRLLFGSLGLRTPKTKDEEESIRAKLMKDIKPMHEPKPAENDKAGEPPAFLVDGDDESWRDKIILKAVECCHDGIELSTPPFPFVQRWDPQQQKPYPNYLKKNFKRNKKRKRNDERYYSDNFEQKIDEETAGLHGSASPRIHHFFNELNPERSTGQTDNNDYDAAISEQLMRETEASASTSVAIEATQDLPSLSEDMSIYASLVENAAKPGAVIAFKQLDMSEETNWQPKVSSYRTALIESLTDDGLIRMALAKRDQSQKQEIYDEKTGERIYSKFEMPGFDDEAAQNVRDVEISFSELIQPKLIQAAEASTVQEEAHCSAHEGGSPRKDTDMTMGDDIEPHVLKDKTPSPELPLEAFNQGTIKKANENVRQEIFDLIKDAGWRSSLCSNNVERLGREPKSVSPTFNGFRSSPPLEDTTKSEEVLIAPGEVTVDSLPSSQRNDTFEIAESLPVQRIATSNSPIHNPSYGGEDVSVKDENVNERSMWGELQHQPNSAESHQISPQQFPSETSLYQSNSSVIQPKGTHAPILSNDSVLGLDDQSSDNEFPTLENVFSQIRSSQARSADDDLSYMEQSSFESTKFNRARTQDSPAAKSKIIGKESISQKSTLFKWDESEIEDKKITPRASQAAVKSQIVDLTLSSDLVHPASDESDYADNGTQLPSGPGWIKKNRSREGRLDAYTNKADLERSSRFMSTGAY